ncbi:MAG: HK97 gp10 family phage protein, partial [Gammaproteobacteria bacterium]|nr:HK97 gp10 family phage protein [Gammaproteobacteria bacterium]
MQIEAEIKGIKELERMLNDLGSKKIEKKLVRSSLRKAAKVVLKEAKDTVPVRTGTLKKSLGIVAKKGARNGSIILAVGA